MRAPTIAAAFVWALSTLMLGGSRAEDQPDTRRLEYRDDRLTVDVQGTRLEDLMTELGRQSGAKIRGHVRKPRDLSLSFDEVPLPDALERVLGEQNFTLRYGPGNRLESVDLLGEPGTPRASAASATDGTGAGSAPSPAPRAGVGGSGAPASGEGPRAAGLSVSVSGAAAASDRAGAPGSAVMLGGGAQTTAQSQQPSNDNSQMSDAELQQRIRRSLLNSLSSMDDASLSAFMDTPEGRRVGTLVQYYADHHLGSHRQQQAAGIIDRIPGAASPAPRGGR